ncbi:hypothetical protein NQ317_018472 [Molorchus minor]|uniref:Uncharacterized protein n=1 Tax=Molorchus minor TaxID=1323400 RepID=A0ABQ9ITJ1_9CUCU|nr:hypothetical protein NQ317_018472 [Molorchus minor]
MREVNEFLSELIDKAQKEAERRNGKPKGKLDALGIQNADLAKILKIATRRIGEARQFKEQNWNPGKADGYYTG